MRSPGAGACTRVRDRYNHEVKTRHQKTGVLKTAAPSGVGRGLEKGGGGRKVQQMCEPESFSRVAFFIPGHVGLRMHQIPPGN